MTVTGMPAGHVSVTQRLVDLGTARGEQPALVGGGAAWPGRTLSYASVARILQMAAAGLSRRGVRPGDVIGVHVPDAVSYVLAGHAVRAAGGVPSPLPYAEPATVLAGQLTDCGARLLITAGPLASAAVSAADAAWVRQVLSFDEVAGTTKFCSLLSRGSQPPAAAAAADLALLPYRPGPGAGRSAAPVTHGELAADLDRLSGGTMLTGEDVVITAPPADDSRVYTVLLDLALLSGATVVAARADALPDAARRHGGTAVIVHPGTPIPAGLALRAVTSRC